MASIFRKVFGTRNDRLIKRLMKTVARINVLGEELGELSDEELAKKTDEFRNRLREGETVDVLLPEVFAVVREAAGRVLGMRHFDVQLIGGMVLHQGDIAEMKTGEGKTLVATLAAYLNALPGNGVHVVTVNDYLARRDAEWMGKVYEFLGLRVGVVVAGMSTEDKKAAYAADITYGTNNEFGFDYLRDNMAFQAEDRVMRGTHFAIVDEVDSILIDEARTPLIISGPAEDHSDLYVRINTVIPKLEPQTEEGGPGDYTVDEKSKAAHLTEDGHEKVEQILTDMGLLEEGSSLYDSANIGMMHHVNAALRAHVLFEKDVDYVVNDGEIVIVDEFTGRLMAGRRWSEGLHQAVEAKENVAIKNENQTLASVTFQNYFRLYDKLSGMTGTADTEAYEFQDIYGLEVVIMPTHHPMIRDDMGDLIFLTKTEKYKAIVADIKECESKRRPVLVGTASIESSEYLSKLLKKEGIKHQVLNAKYHAKEADIVAAAGVPGAVTIATNMAGRGTDIVLGGNLDKELSAIDPDDDDKREAARADWQARHDEVLELGGLHVIATERNESRRIDNQLRGRSGRQGDPGSSRFYLSLEDDLMRIFASERMAGLMQRLGMEEDEAIEHRWVTRAIENAQKKVEGRNFDIRKNLLEYDDIANDQRKVIYQQRDVLLATDDISAMVASMRKDVMNSTISMFVPRGSLEEQWDVKGLEETLAGDFDLHCPVSQWLEDDNSLHEESLREQLLEAVEHAADEKAKQVPSEILRQFEKAVMLQLLDNHWKEHLAAMDHLRQGIHLRGYAQKNPIQEYKKESFELFKGMLDEVKVEVTKTLMRVKVRAEEDVEAVESQRQSEENHQYEHGTVSAVERADTEPGSEPRSPFMRDGRKIGRNEPCPCGSGKKYKQCHGVVS